MADPFVPPLFIIWTRRLEVPNTTKLEWLSTGLSVIHWSSLGFGILLYFLKQKIPLCFTLSILLFIYCVPFICFTSILSFALCAVVNPDHCHFFCRLQFYIYIFCLIKLLISCIFSNLAFLPFMRWSFIEGNKSSSSKSAIILKYFYCDFVNTAISEWFKILKNASSVEFCNPKNQIKRIS